MVDLIFIAYVLFFGEQYVFFFIFLNFVYEAVNNIDFSETLCFHFKH